MQEETDWRRRLLRKVPNWLHCATPSPSTPRAPMLSSRPLSPHSIPKVIRDTHTACTAYRFFGGWVSPLWFKLTKKFSNPLCSVLSSVHDGMGIRITGNEKIRPDRGKSTMPWNMGVHGFHREPLSFFVGFLVEKKDLNHPRWVFAFAQSSIVK